MGLDRPRLNSLDAWRREPRLIPRAGPVVASTGLALVEAAPAGPVLDVADGPHLGPHLGPERGDDQAGEQATIAVTEVVAQPRADQQPVPGINGKIPAIEQGVHVRPGQQPVVQTVLTALGHRPDIRCLREPAGGRAGGPGNPAEVAPGSVRRPLPWSAFPGEPPAVGQVPGAGQQRRHAEPEQQGVLEPGRAAAAGGGGRGGDGLALGVVP